MPMSRRVLTTGGKIHGRPVHGIAEYVAQRAVNVAALTTFEVDADGFLIPGVVFDSAGALVATGIATYGVVMEPIKVALSNAAGDLTAAGVVQVGLLLIGMVNRKIAEDNMGRVYTSFELAGFNLAGSKLILLQ